ncbi:hypothetical protein [Pseudoxanthomonas suwonensis]|uniref:hypothetical protein n=1 Tax=Pseudoxanthomonas suwonensis TaxID=314722 RepID=UPI00138F40EC|nr:hypothetical protein [Pseudoxanthomonas suwonensis]KAF1702463.1 hypothetical protein CSC68_06050 [Pseudoxanthomonas suwonensis]
MDAVAALVVAITGLPALGVAAWYARYEDEHARGLALRWSLIALAILCGAVGLYFAGGSRGATTAVAVAMAVAVNALAVSTVLHVRRGRGG